MTVGLVSSFLKIFDRNGALLMKVKWSQNRFYKILMKDHQNLLEPSIGIGGMKLKKKPLNQEKKESKNRAKKIPEATLVNEEQPTS